MVEFAQRKMVQQGITPSTPESMGTGITSGLMDKAPDNLQAGIMATGQAIQNLNRNLDNAERFERICVVHKKQIDGTDWEAVAETSYVCF